MITVAHNMKRTIKVTSGNIRNAHIPVTRLLDVLPSDCLGSSKKSNGIGKTVRIWLEGLDKAIETDIARDVKTGKPRRQFRDRRWIKRFFQHNKVLAGDELEFERLGDREYRLRLLRTQPRIAELFAGIGLVRLALERCGLRVVFANDIEPDKLDIYKDNFSTDDFRLGDIQLLHGRDIPDCDLATASFPCTDLSIAGSMNGIHSGESSTFWEFIRLLEEMDERRPPVVLIENVPGFLMSHGGRDFKAALLSLNKLGYACDAFLLDAAHFVPQSRLRLFVVGKLGSAYESPILTSPTPVRPRLLVDFIAANPEIRWAIGKLPMPPKHKISLESILENLPDNHPAWWNKERADYFVSQFSERHRDIAKKMIAGRCNSYGTAFRRIRNGRSMAELRTDGLAGCLRTPRGGSGRQILFKAGKGRYQVRLLTARECARLQGVPDTYQINVSLNQALFGFGDAVCVPVIEWITKHYLLECLNDINRSFNPELVLGAP